MFEKEVNSEKIEKADLVVCIPSYNEADAISYPTEQANEGLVKYFSEMSSVMVLFIILFEIKIIGRDGRTATNTKAIAIFNLILEPISDDSE